MSWGADNGRTDTYVFLIDSIYFFLGGGGEIILQNSIIVFFIDLECAQYLHLEDESTGCDKIQRVFFLAARPPPIAPSLFLSSFC